jgi:hypothetical protein
VCGGVGVPVDFESQMLLPRRGGATPSFEYQRSRNICALVCLCQLQTPKPEIQ